METISNWLEKKYLEWQIERGRASLTAFAEFLGITRGYLGMMLNGSRPNVSMEIAYQIGERLDDFSILVLLGYPVPDAPLVGFSEEERSAILAWLGSLKDALAGLSPAERDAKLKAMLSPDETTSTDTD